MVGIATITGVTPFSTGGPMTATDHDNFAQDLLASLAIEHSDIDGIEFAPAQAESRNLDFLESVRHHAECMGHPGTATVRKFIEPSD